MAFPIYIQADLADFDSPLDIRRCATPAFWAGSDVEFRICVFSFGSMRNVSDFASLTLEIKPMGANGARPEPATAPLMSKTITGFDDDVTLTEWTSYTYAQAIVSFNSNETAITAGSHWFVITALTKDTTPQTLTLCAGTVIVEEDGQGVAGEVQVVDGTAYTKTQADIRYARAVSGSAVYVDALGGSDYTGTIGRADLPYATLQSALSAAQAGDSVYVAAGSYATASVAKAVHLSFAAGTELDGALTLAASGVSVSGVLKVASTASYSLTAASAYSATIDGVLTVNKPINSNITLSGGILVDRSTLSVTHAGLSGDLGSSTSSGGVTYDDSRVDALEASASELENRATALESGASTEAAARVSADASEAATRLRSDLRLLRPHGAMFESSTGSIALADNGSCHIVDAGRSGMTLLLGVTTPSDITGTQYLEATLAGETGTSGWALKMVDGVLCFGRGIATGPEWVITGNTLAANTFYEIRINWDVATVGSFKIALNKTDVTAGVTSNNLTSAPWVTCTNKLYFGSDASGTNNVKAGCIIHDRPELYNYALTDAQWATWLANDIVPTTGFGTMNVVENGDFLDGENDWNFNGYTSHSVTDGVLSFTCCVDNPGSNMFYLYGSAALAMLDPTRTYTATARVRRASGTTGSVGFGQGWGGGLTSVTPAADDTSWYTITTTVTPGSSFGVYGTTTTAGWQMDYLIISLSGNLLHGLEFSAQPLQAHATNNAFWTFSNASPWPCASSRYATFKTPLVVIADGSIGLTTPVNWRWVTSSARNSGTTAMASVYVRQGSTSGGAIFTVNAGAHVCTSANLAAGVAVMTSYPIYATGLVAGNRARFELNMCR